MFGWLKGTLRSAWAAGYDLQARGNEDGFVGEARRTLLAAVHGDVLEIGAGRGANIPHYPRRRDLRVIATDPDPAMLARARRRPLDGLNLEFREMGAYPLPFPAQTFDFVVVTLALCTIPDPARALAEARRVLRDEGRLLFIEHVRARDDHPRIGRWQDRMAPAWKLCAHGCRINQDTRQLIADSGFGFEWIEERYEPDVWLPILRVGIGGVAVKN
jgi:ubiquinone/menaquinone biosynthesis C-methylase UbiE